MAASSRVDGDPVCDCAPPFHIKFSLSKRPLVVMPPPSRFPRKEEGGGYGCCPSLHQLSQTSGDTEWGPSNKVEGCK